MSSNIGHLRNTCRGNWLTLMARFLLVSLNIDAILGEVTIYKRRKKLEDVTKGKMLGDAYTATLTRIKSQNGSKSQLGIEALMWISHSERPLKAIELCQALGVERGETDQNTGQCSQPSSPSVFGGGRDGLWLVVRLFGGARTDYAREGKDRTDYRGL